MVGSSTADVLGRQASTPWSIPLSGWRDIALRSWREAAQDNIGLVASGVAFCAVLAMVPALGAIVLTYGLVATPETVSSNIHSLASMMPSEAARLIGEQLDNVVHASDGKKGVGLIVALAIAIYGVMKGASALITALNIAYDEHERRGFVRLNLIALAIAAGGVGAAIMAMLAIAALASLEALFPSTPWYVTLAGKIFSYALVGGGGAALAATVYRYGPNRKAAKWAWLTPGSIFTSVSWMAMTFGFGVYVANFGNYDATYGSLGAAMVLLTWLYLSAYVLLLGAELNCELEKQTARDTTTGVDMPMGERGAYAADTIAAGPDPEPEAGPGPHSAIVAPTEPKTESISKISRPSRLKHFLATRAVARAQSAAGLGKAGFFSSALASSGLAMIRRRDGVMKGAVVLIAAGALSWMGRESDRQDSNS